MHRRVVVLPLPLPFWLDRTTWRGHEENWTKRMHWINMLMPNSILSAVNKDSDVHPSNATKLKLRFKTHTHTHTAAAAFISDVSSTCALSFRPGGEMVYSLKHVAYVHSTWLCWKFWRWLDPRWKVRYTPMCVCQHRRTARETKD